MEGLETVEINFSALQDEHNKLRLDAEFYKRKYVSYTNILKNKNTIALGSVSFITDGIHESIDFDNESEVNLISAKSPKENYFDLSSNHHISTKQHLKNPRTELAINDVIVSTVGTIGNCAVVQQDILPANSDRHVGIIRLKKDIKPHFLSTFLLSKYGRFQTFRESTGNVQLNLFIYKIKELLVPKLDKSFQLKIEHICVNAFQNQLLSKNLYKKAESILLKEVGLLNVVTGTNPSQVKTNPNSENSSFSTKNYNIKNLKESFKSTGRLDSDYYLPKYEEVIRKIIMQPHDTLENIVTIKKSIEPGSAYYDNEGLPFMRVADISKNGLTEPQKFLNSDFLNENKQKIKDLKPKKGTIFFSKDGSVGTAYHLRKDFEGITSSAILHLKVKNEKKVIPEYLTLVLNSQLVQMQAERDAGGSIILHWRIKEIENVIVPIIDPTKQQQIATLIEESFSLKKQSEQLLDVAKRAVEIAIEKNEETALDYIKKSTID